MKKTVFNALRNTIFTAACIHLTLLAIYSVSTGKLLYINIAHILDLGLYFPHIHFNVTTGVIASLPFLTLFGFFFWRANRINQKA